MSLRNLDDGQDSFLDIIANLVGVLIILVVIVGAQATANFVSKQDAEPASVEQPSSAENNLAFEQRQAELKSELALHEMVAT